MKRPKGQPRQAEKQRLNRPSSKPVLTDEDIQSLAKFVRILERVQERETKKENNNDKDNSKNEKTKIRSKKRSRQ